MYYSGLFVGRRRFRKIKPINFSMAFNTVDHNLLLQTMDHLGFPPMAINAIKGLYASATTHVRVPAGMTDPIPVRLGTVQGDTLSPLLFLIFIEPLLRWLQVGGRGYKVRALGNGNISSLSNQISIPIEALFFIPDAFTPNEDNMNNLFEIKGRFGRVNDYHLTIYDRWGNRITEITDKTQSWDGKLNGIPLPLGSYLYDLKIGLNKGEIIRKFGKFEIL